MWAGFNWPKNRKLVLVYTMEIIWFSPKEGISLAAESFGTGAPWQFLVPVGRLGFLPLLAGRPTRSRFNLCCTVY